MAIFKDLANRMIITRLWLRGWAKSPSLLTVFGLPSKMQWLIYLSSKRTRWTNIRYLKNRNPHMKVPTFFILIDGTMIDLFFLFDVIFEIFLSFFIGFCFFLQPFFFGLVKVFCGDNIFRHFKVFVECSCSFSTYP